jgi:hypothetical protein
MSKNFPFFVKPKIHLKFGIPSTKSLTEFMIEFK